MITLALGVGHLLLMLTGAVVAGFIVIPGFALLRGRG